MKRHSIISMLAAVAAAVLLLAGCAQGGIGDEEAEEIRGELNEVQARLDAAEERIQAIAGGGGGEVEELAGEAQQELDEARDRLADVDERLAPPPPPEDAPADPGMADPADAPAF